MEIVLAKNAGFCFGVKRAVDKVYEVLEHCQSSVDSPVGDIYSTGPIIHNELVSSELKGKGLIELDNDEEIKNIKNSKVIVRTHGIEKSIYDKLIQNGNEVIDLTCPFVSKIHDIVRNYSENGYNIIVIGDKNHPEVKGIISYSKTPISVIINESDIQGLKIDKNSKVLVVFQTTTNYTNAQKLVDILKDLFYNINVINTVCNATENRQNEVSELSKHSDLMLIVGSKTSSNTKKLYEISKKNLEDTYLVCDKNDLDGIDFNKYNKVGISAGASTPEYQVEEILSQCKK